MPPPPPSPPPCSGMFPLVSGGWGGYGAPAWPAIPSAHPVRASMTKSAASHRRQFITSSEPRDPESLSRANDGFDQARVIVLDVADPRADGPGDHFLSRVRHE